MAPKAKRYTDIMLDLETLGLPSSSIIVSVGAVRFTLDGDMDVDNTFYGVCSIDQPGRTYSPSTIEWWMKQSDEARYVFDDKAKQPLPMVLKNFAQWVGDGTARMWSNGADFDIPMIVHAMNQHNITVAWPFWNHRCFRTMKSGEPGCWVTPPQKPQIAHNALHDAVAQAQHLIAISKAIREGSAVPNKPFSAKAKA